MEHADILIKNGMILTMDNNDTIYDDGVVAIKDDLIIYIGEKKEKEFSAKKIIDAREKLVMPGLINCHTHAPMSLFKGIADDIPLMEWLTKYIFPVEKNMDEEFVYNGAMLACVEMIMSGTTTFCDMYLFEEQVALAGKDTGMRCLVGEVLYDFDSPNYGPIDEGFRYTEKLIKRWRHDTLVSIAVEPHATFTCSPELLKKAHEIALEYNVPMVIHLSETQNEVEETKKNYGRRPAEHLNSVGILYPGLIAVHCVHLENYEIELLKDHGVRVVNVPESNLKLGSGIAPVPEMMEAGITVGLGTDGSASNNNLDMFSEMDTSAKIQKVRCMDTTVMDAKTVVRMATIDGAKTLGLDHITGSIEKGKKADIIILDLNKAHLTPIYNPLSHIVYAAGGGDVTHSIINGRIVMEERKLINIDLDDIIERANREAKRVREWTGIKY